MKAIFFSTAAILLATAPAQAQLLGGTGLGGQLGGTLELLDTPGGGLTVRIGLPEHTEKTATGGPVAVSDGSP